MLWLYLPKGSVIIHSPWWILCLFISKHLFNSLFPNSGIHIPHTVLLTFPLILTKRICLTIRSLPN